MAAVDEDNDDVVVLLVIVILAIGDNKDGEEAEFEFVLPQSSTTAPPITMLFGDIEFEFVVVTVVVSGGDDTVNGDVLVVLTLVDVKHELVDEN